jgi:hypothetical protein
MDPLLAILAILVAVPTAVLSTLQIRKEWREMRKENQHTSRKGSMQHHMNRTHGR